MGKLLGYLLVILLIQYVASDAQCTIEQEGKEWCDIKITCPEHNMSPNEKTIIEKIDNCEKSINIFLKKVAVFDFSGIKDKLKNVAIIEWKDSGLKDYPAMIYEAMNIEELSLSQNELNSAPDVSRLAKLKKLDISSNLIETLSELHCDTLESINLSRNKINDIPDAHFMTCKNLGTLDLSYNDIRTISVSHLRSLQHLHALKLSHNKLTSLNQQLFPLEELVTLEVDFNEINYISKDAFETLRKLETLNLNSNNIKDIDETIFWKLSNLKDLNLGSNQLVHITKKMFENNKILSKLDASHNNISIIEPDSFMNNKISEFKIKNNKLQGAINESFLTGLLVTDLDLSQTQITEIPDNCFNSLPNLQKLDLSKNEIKKISKKAFKEDNVVEKVDVSHNKLADLQFITNLHSLNELYASFNKIHNLEKELFGTTKKISILDLSNNSIGSLQKGILNSLKLTSFNCSNCSLLSVDVESFSDIETLRNLDLSSNSLTEAGFLKNVPVELSILILSHNKLTDASFIIQFKKLSKLDCSFNEISKLDELAFAGHTELKYVDLSSNYELTISTHFKSLTIQEVYLNRIKKIDFNDAPCTINKLTISGCGISDIDVVHLSYIEKLNYLELRDNNIHNISKSSFEKLTSLKDLDLGGNKINIKDGVFEKLQQLEGLYLSNIGISSLDPKTFTFLLNLKRIDLSNNEISRIDDDVFVNNKKLEIVNLHKNKINFLVVKAFNRLNNLKKLDLSQNKLNTFGPHFVSSEASEINIFLNDNLISDPDNFRLKEFSETSFKILNISGNHVEIDDIKKQINEFGLDSKVILTFIADASTTTPKDTTTTPKYTTTTPKDTTTTPKDTTTTLEDTTTTPKHTTTTPKHTTTTPKHTTTTPKHTTTTPKHTTTTPKHTTTTPKDTTTATYNQKPLKPDSSDKLKVALICVSTISTSIVIVVAGMKLYSYFQSRNVASQGV